MQGPFSATLGLVQPITDVSTFRLSPWNAPGLLCLISSDHPAHLTIGRKICLAAFGCRQLSSKYAQYFMCY